jgi:hypothetical protein
VLAGARIASSILAGPGSGGATAKWRSPNEAGLPEGFPAPTAPGEVRVKFYPRVRGAFTRVEGRFDSATRRAFWPLFRHIKQEGIAMTAPVLAHYSQHIYEGEQGAADVAFLYPSLRSGPVRQGDVVRVSDLDTMAVISVGVMGRYDMQTMRAALDRLDTWLKENGGTWQRAGTPRRLMYQRPSFWKGSRIYSEVQIPIRPAPLEE